MIVIKEICVIGASNVDIIAKSSKKLENDTSTIGNIKLVPGGVGRNIVDNLSRLHVYTMFISVFGKDVLGKFLIDSMDNKYINLEHSIYNANDTSKFLNILNNEENYGINDIKNINALNISFFHKKMPIIDTMEYLVLDMNLDQDALEYIIITAKTKIICEATSSIKCKKIINVLGNIYILKANFTEACVIADCSLNVSYEELINKLMSKGVKKTYITLGDKGAIYADEGIKIHLKNKKAINKCNTLGAGDVFMSAVMYGETQELSHIDIMLFAIKLSYCYIMHEGFQLDEKVIREAHCMNNDIYECYVWDERENVWREKKELLL